jgi:hypothetical protein
MRETGSSQEDGSAMMHMGKPLLVEPKSFVVKRGQ